MPSLARQISLRLNRRLTTTVARYLRRDRTIEISSRFLALRARRREVLVHELAHAAVDLAASKRFSPHGPEWQALVQAAGYRARARMTRPATFTPARRAARYEHRCPVCQMVRMASQPVTRWRCRSCVEMGLPGGLEITRKAAAR